nr:Centromere protein like [Ipomoea batatas]
MEEIASLWNYEELQAMDELKQRLLYTSLELEQLRIEACEETRKSSEYVKQLIHLVKIACRERDEARDQLQKLMFMNVNYSITANNSCNNNITESNSFSETLNNHHSHGSSPPAPAPESFLKVGPSTELLNADYNVKIESLVKGKPLPEKGRFLQAVLEAPPLLQTLIVAAPLPRWRNPPQLKPFHIPPVSIRAANEAEISVQGISVTSHPHPYFEMSSNTMLNNNNVGNFPSATLLGSQMMISAGNYGHPGKRQRFL